MADDLNEDDVPPADVPPATTKAKRTPEPPPAPADEFDGMSPEELREALAKERKLKAAANKEAMNNRRRAQELEDAEEKRKDQLLSDEDRRKRELEQARREAADRKAEAEAARLELLQVKKDRAIEEEAARQGVKKPRQASSLLRGDPSFGAVDWDDEGNRAVGHKEAIKKLIEAYPNLLEDGGMPRGGGTPPRDYGRPPMSGRPNGQPNQQPIDKSEYDVAQLRSMLGRGGDVRF